VHEQDEDHESDGDGEWINEPTMARKPFMDQFKIFTPTSASASMPSSWSSPASMPRESVEDTIKRMQAELKADLEAMRAKLVRAEPPGLRSPKTPLKGAAVAAPDAGAAKARAPCCERGVQTATSLPHTQRDILWTASGLDSVLEDEGETTSQEGVDDARGTIYDVDILVQDWRDGCDVRC
jgi:hypothetical protein